MGIASGNDDGSIQIWDCKRTVQPKYRIFNAHVPTERITCVQFSFDNLHLCSRSTDGTVKLWDMRNTKKVYCEADNLPARFDGSAIAFSPNDKLILAGTALEGPRDPNPSKLVF